MKKAFKTLRLAFGTFVFTLICAAFINGQREFKLVSNSKNVGVTVKVGECSAKIPYHCPAKFQLFHKGNNRPFQTISLVTSFSDPNDIQDIEFGDFNFDGLEDLAISDGRNGGYLTASYHIFLFSRELRRYVHNADFTKLSQGPAMGLFEVDKRKKILYRQYRTGCCYFVKEGYDVYMMRPRKVYELIQDESSADRIWDVTTTKKFINGRWRTWVKRERASK